MNARERLAAVADWLGYNDEQLSFGLRNAFDALRLYDYSQAHPELPEMADEWEESDLIAALGYSPYEFDQSEAILSHEADTSGAGKAAEAIRAARKLLDSVAFVAKDGDTAPVIEALDEVIPA
ncbi:MULTISPECIES: hypothetical protein [Pandoraea]|uniref:Uncharacterized protein n=2 Tax=Pandoraea TaxID=93217 RepID=A0A5E4XJ10_9BURK|nr:MULTISPECIES: hypothetical protein [Pandoraea]VVE18347.1 hypothetical protein PCE31107_03015 [Pandoraea cepalis]VVE36158.1 hypothetical protein PTE31013_03936 [Pandoraea terrigena]